VSPLQPVFARECEKEETLARVRERNVLGSAPAHACERERERERKIGRGTARRTRAEDGERDIPRAGEENGSGAEVKRTRRGDSLLSRLFVIASFFRERERRKRERKKKRNKERRRKEEEKRSESRRGIVRFYDLEECVVSE